MEHSILKDHICVAPDDIVNEELIENNAKVPELKNAKNTSQKWEVSIQARKPCRKNPD